MNKVRYLQALNQALRDEMARDPSVFMLGEDIRVSLRGLTKGLLDEFGPERILDAPISEAAWTGFATGAALAGRRPVLEVQIPSMLFLAFEQIVNQAQKIRLMTGGQAKVPVTYLIPGTGARLGLAAHHSDNPYPMFMNGGVKCVMPATADDAYGLTLSAIRDDDPVMIFAPSAALGKREEADNPFEAVPLGKGRLRREGTDVTLLATGHLVFEAVALSDKLRDENISIEVFDPRTLFPMDYELLAESVSKTGRLVIVDDSNWTCGFAADVAANIVDLCWSDLKAPIKRVTRYDAPIPFAVPLEQAVVASISLAEARIREVLRERR